MKISKSCQKTATQRLLRRRSLLLPMPIILTCTTLLLTLPWRQVCGGNQESGGHLRVSTSVLATVLTSPSSVRVTAVNLADIIRCVAYVLFWVHLFVTFDCVYFQRSCNVTNLERVNLLQEQVATTLLDPRNIPDLNCIPPDQHDQGWRSCTVWSLP